MKNKKISIIFVLFEILLILSTPIAYSYCSKEEPPKTNIKDQNNCGGSQNCDDCSTIYMGTMPIETCNWGDIKGGEQCVSYESCAGSAGFGISMNCNFDKDKFDWTNGDFNIFDSNELTLLYGSPITYYEILKNFLYKVTDISKLPPALLNEVVKDLYDLDSLSGEIEGCVIGIEGELFCGSCFSVGADTYCNGKKYDLATFKGSSLTITEKGLNDNGKIFEGEFSDVKKNEDGTYNINNKGDLTVAENDKVNIDVTENQITINSQNSLSVFETEEGRLLSNEGKTSKLNYKDGKLQSIEIEDGTYYDKKTETVVSSRKDDKTTENMDESKSLLIYTDIDSYNSGTGNKVYLSDDKNEIKGKGEYRLNREGDDTHTELRVEGKDKEAEFSYKQEIEHSGKVTETIASTGLIVVEDRYDIYEGLQKGATYEKKSFENTETSNIDGTEDGNVAKIIKKVRVATAGGVQDIDVNNKEAMVTDVEEFQITTTIKRSDGQISSYGFQKDFLKIADYLKDNMDAALVLEKENTLTVGKNEEKIFITKDGKVQYTNGATGVTTYVDYGIPEDQIFFTGNGIKYQTGSSATGTILEYLVSDKYLTDKYYENQKNIQELLKKYGGAPIVIGGTVIPLTPDLVFALNKQKIETLEKNLKDYQSTMQNKAAEVSNIVTEMNSIISVAETNPEALTQEMKDRYFILEAQYNSKEKEYQNLKKSIEAQYDKTFADYQTAINNYNGMYDEILPAMEKTANLGQKINERGANRDAFSGYKIDLVTDMPALLRSDDEIKLDVYGADYTSSKYLYYREKQNNNYDDAAKVLNTLITSLNKQVEAFEQGGSLYQYKSLTKDESTILNQRKQEIDALQNEMYVLASKAAADYNSKNNLPFSINAEDMVSYWTNREDKYITDFSDGFIEEYLLGSQSTTAGEIADAVKTNQENSWYADKNRLLLSSGGKEEWVKMIKSGSGIQVANAIFDTGLNLQNMLDASVSMNPSEIDKTNGQYRNKDGVWVKFDVATYDAGKRIWSNRDTLLQNGALTNFFSLAQQYSIYYTVDPGDGVNPYTIKVTCTDPDVQFQCNELKQKLSIAQSEYNRINKDIESMLYYADVVNKAMTVGEKATYDAQKTKAISDQIWSSLADQISQGKAFDLLEAAADIKTLDMSFRSKEGIDVSNAEFQNFLNTDLYVKLSLETEQKLQTAKTKTDIIEIQSNYNEKMGDIYRKMGAVEAANLYYDAAMEIDPKNSAALYKQNDMNGVGADWGDNTWRQLLIIKPSEKLKYDIGGEFLLPNEDSGTTKLYLGSAINYDVVKSYARSMTDLPTMVVSMGIGAAMSAVTSPVKSLAMKGVTKVLENVATKSDDIARIIATGEKVAATVAKATAYVNERAALKILTQATTKSFDFLVTEQFKEVVVEQWIGDVIALAANKAFKTDLSNTMLLENIQEYVLDAGGGPDLKQRSVIAAVDIQSMEMRINDNNKIIDKVQARINNNNKLLADNYGIQDATDQIIIDESIAKYPSQVSKITSIVENVLKDQSQIDFLKIENEYSGARKENAILQKEMIEAQTKGDIITQNQKSEEMLNTAKVYLEKEVSYVEAMKETGKLTEEGYQSYQATLDYKRKKVEVNDIRTQIDEKNQLLQDINEQLAEENTVELREAKNQLQTEITYLQRQMATGLKEIYQKDVENIDTVLNTPELKKDYKSQQIQGLMNEKAMRENQIQTTEIQEQNKIIEETNQELNDKYKESGYVLNEAGEIVSTPSTQNSEQTKEINDLKEKINAEEEKKAVMEEGITKKFTETQNKLQEQVKPYLALSKSENNIINELDKKYSDAIEINKLETSKNQQVVLTTINEQELSTLSEKEQANVNNLVTNLEKLQRERVNKVNEKYNEFDRSFGSIAEILAKQEEAAKEEQKTVPRKFENTAPTVEQPKAITMPKAIEQKAETTKETTTEKTETPKETVVQKTDESSQFIEVKYDLLTAMEVNQLLEDGMPQKTIDELQEVNKKGLGINIMEDINKMSNPDTYGSLTTLEKNQLVDVIWPSMYASGTVGAAKIYTSKDEMLKDFRSILFSDIESLDLKNKDYIFLITKDGEIFFAESSNIIQRYLIENEGVIKKEIFTSGEIRNKGATRGNIIFGSVKKVDYGLLKQYIDKFFAEDVRVQGYKILAFDEGTNVYIENGETVIKTKRMDSRMTAIKGQASKLFHRIMIEERGSVALFGVPEIEKSILDKNSEKILSDIIDKNNLDVLTSENSPLFTELEKYDISEATKSQIKNSMNRAEMIGTLEKDDSINSISSKIYDKIQKEEVSTVMDKKEYNRLFGEKIDDYLINQIPDSIEVYRGIVGEEYAGKANEKGTSFWTIGEKGMDNTLIYREKATKDNSGNFVILKTTFGELKKAGKLQYGQTAIIENDVVVTHFKTGEEYAAVENFEILEVDEEGNVIMKEEQVAGEVKKGFFENVRSILVSEGGFLNLGEIFKSERTIENEKPVEITREVNPNILYHGTDINNIDTILEEGEIKVSHSQFDTIGETTISLSYSWDITKSFGSVAFEISKDKLQNIKEMSQAETSLKEVRSYDNIPLSDVNKVIITVKEGENLNSVVQSKKNLLQRLFTDKKTAEEVIQLFEEKRLDVEVVTEKNKLIYSTVVERNSILTDDVRKVEAQRLLIESNPERTLTKEQGDALIAAHNKGTSGVYEYTTTELKEKIAILEKAGFIGWKEKYEEGEINEIKLILEVGLAGKAAVSREVKQRALKAKQQSYANSNNFDRTSVKNRIREVNKQLDIQAEDLAARDVLLNSKTLSYANRVMKYQGMEKIIRYKDLVVIPENYLVEFVGDTHSDVESLKKILEQTNFFEKAENGEKFALVFLGDYVDRLYAQGPKGIENMLLLMEIYKRYPDNVVLERGNHETEKTNKRYGLMEYLLNIYKKESTATEIWNELNSMFEKLPIFTVTANGYVAVHGGVPQGITSLSDLAQLTEEQKFQAIWNDPLENGQEEFSLSRRSKEARLFNKAALNKFLQNIEANVMVRSHEEGKVKGDKIMNKENVEMGNKIYTIFSTTYGGSVKTPVIFETHTSTKRFRETKITGIYYASSEIKPEITTEISNNVNQKIEQSQKPTPQSNVPNTPTQTETQSFENGQKVLEVPEVIFDDRGITQTQSESSTSQSPTTVPQSTEKSPYQIAAGLLGKEIITKSDGEYLRDKITGEEAKINPDNSQVHNIVKNTEGILQMPSSLSDEMKKQIVSKFLPDFKAYMDQNNLKFSSDGQQIEESSSYSPHKRYEVVMDWMMRDRLKYTYEFEGLNDIYKDEDGNIINAEKAEKAINNIKANYYKKYIEEIEQENEVINQGTATKSRLTPAKKGAIATAVVSALIGAAVSAILWDNCIIFKERPECSKDITIEDGNGDDKPITDDEKDGETGDEGTEKDCADINEACSILACCETLECKPYTSIITTPTPQKITENRCLSKDTCAHEKDICSELPCCEEEGTVCTTYSLPTFMGSAQLCIKEETAIQPPQDGGIIPEIIDEGGEEPIEVEPETEEPSVIPEVEPEIIKQNAKLQLLINGIDKDLVLEQEDNKNLELYGKVIEGDQANIVIRVEGNIIEQGDNEIKTTYLFNDSGKYEVTLNYPETENYIQTSVKHKVIVKKNETPIWLEYGENPASYSLRSASINYTFWIAWFDKEVIKQVMIENNFNGTLANYTINSDTNNYTYTTNNLSAGNYSYKWIAINKNELYVSTPNITYIVNKSLPYLNFTINNLNDAIIKIDQGGIKINASLLEPIEGHIELYFNNTYINESNYNSSFNGTRYNITNSSLEYLLNLTYGYYNATLVYNETENYSKFEITRFVNVTNLHAGSILIVTIRTEQS
jgi:hypothetical protein